MADADTDWPALFARVFGEGAGAQVLAHLAERTGRALGPGTDERTLFHREGQRFLVQYIANLTKRGLHG